MSPSFSKPLALTQGDPAGIGPEIALMAWHRRFDLSLPPFLFLGDPALLRSRAQQLNLDITFRETDETEACARFADAFPVLPLGHNSKAVIPGQPDAATAQTTIAAIEKGVRLTLEGKTLGVVTNPIAKSVLYEAGFKFPGHTEFLADLAARATGRDITPVMMLAGPRLRTIPVTIHMALQEVPVALTRELIVEICRITDHDLKTKFGIEKPRLAIAGLNPHAGENGTMGDEEERVIWPAIQQLQQEGIHAFGPLPADTMFHEQARQTYDVAICMYHDQALIPAKALGFDDAVNVTLGLPFVRTSPDHGTAFPIAGKGVARPDSLIAALRLASQLGQKADTPS